MPLQLKSGVPVAAPSPIAARGGKFRELGNVPYVKPDEGHPDPSLLVKQYADAAVLAKKAGFDGVELHAANGYLPAQFFDSSSNHRTHDWGGSVEKRARFVFECLKVMIDVWGADRVGIKLNPCGGYNDVGMDEKDTLEEFTYIINHCVKIGLAYIQLVRYVAVMDPIFDGKPRALTHLDVLAAFEPLIHAPGSSTKIFYNGELGIKEGNDLISDGKIDVAVFGRPFINNPDLPKRIFNHWPLNESMGFPNIPKKFYVFVDQPCDGYTTWPTYEEAVAAGHWEGHQ